VGSPKPRHDNAKAGNEHGEDGHVPYEDLPGGDQGSGQAAAQTNECTIVHATGLDPK
jgi:hypothetical protein